MSENLAVEYKGGQGSGNFGHAGRLGKVGGSAPGIGRIFTPQMQAEYNSSLIRQIFVADSGGADFDWFSQTLRGHLKDTICKGISEEAYANYSGVNMLLGAWAYGTYKPECVLLAKAVSEQLGIPLHWSPGQHKAEVELQQAQKREETAEAAWNYYYELGLPEKSQIRWEMAPSDYPEYLSAKARFLDRFPEWVSIEFQDYTDWQGALNSGWGLPEHRKDIPRIAKAIYARTQKRLKEAGVEGTVHLYRGLGFSDLRYSPGEPVGGKRVRPAKWGNKGILRQYNGNTLESWSFSPASASAFGAVIEADVPVSSIFSLATTGLGCLPEREVVVLGSTVKRVSYYSKAAEEEATKGGTGSGNFGHSGRPGKVGGSAPGKGIPRLGKRSKFPLKGGKAIPGIESDRWSGADDDVPAEINRNHLSSVRPESVERRLGVGKADWGRYEIEFASLAENNPGIIKDDVCSEIAKAAGVDYERVNGMLAGWAKESNSQEMLFFQYAVAEEFGAEMGEFQQTALREMGFNPEYLRTGEAGADFERRIEFYKKFRKVQEIATLYAGQINYEGEPMQDVPQTSGWAGPPGLENRLAEAGLLEFARTMRAEAHQLEPDLYDEMPETYQIGIGAGIHEANARWRRLYPYVELRESINDYRKIARAMYNRTQAELARHGISGSVRLFRGSSHYPLRAKGKSNRVRIKGNVLESWSTQSHTAHDFGNVLVMDVPSENIFCLPTTGLGCWNESEVVIFGSGTNYASPVGNLGRYSW